MVTSVAHRWKSLEIRHEDVSPPGELDVASLARIPSDGLKSLEKLVLIWTIPENQDGPELENFQFAPRLRDVTINGPFIFPMPWTQLTHLSLENDSPQLCLDILVRCNSIVSAHIATKQWLESDDPDTSIIAGTGFLAHLEELDINICIWATGEHLGPFLRRLRLPILKSLALSLHVPYGVEEYFISWLTPALVFFLTRSPNLECLKLDDCVFEDDVPDILRLTPNLAELSFSNSAVYDDFFAALRYSETDESPPLVPKLETLALTNVGEEFAEASLAEMIRSRWWSDDELLAMPTPPRIARLKSLIHWDDDFDGDDTIFTKELTNTMDTYRLQGLIVDCVYSYVNSKPWRS